MNVTTTPQTFAKTITVCAACGNEVAYIEADGNSRWLIRPCGHYAGLTVIANPKLCSA